MGLPRTLYKVGISSAILGFLFPVWFGEEEREKKNLPERLWLYLIMGGFGYGRGCGSGFSYTDTKSSHLRREMETFYLHGLLIKIVSTRQFSMISLRSVQGIIQCFGPAPLRSATCPPSSTLNTAPSLAPSRASQ